MTGVQTCARPIYRLLEEPKLKYADCWPMVRITWMDAMNGDTGWVPLSKMRDAKLATCIDIGWMIRNDDLRVTIMGSWCLDPQEDKDEDKGTRTRTGPGPGQGLARTRTRTRTGRGLGPED